MRVAWLNHRDIGHPSAGGSERTLAEVGRRLVNSGHEVSVLSTAWQGGATRDEYDGVRVRRIPTTAGVHLAVGAFLRTRPHPDVVVDDLAHAIPWGSPWLCDLPVVAFFHHLHARTLHGQVGGPLAAGLTAVERTYPVIYRSSRFVTESESSLADLRQLGVPAAQCERILPGVDLERFRPGLRSHRPRLLYFGGLRNYKRADHSATVLRRLVDTGHDCELQVVGRGPALSSLIEAGRREQVSDRMTFSGWLSPNALAELVRSSWVNLHFSVAEGWGFTVLEAAASGVPTVAYRVPGLTDSVREGENGRLVPDGDLSAFSDAVADLLERPGAISERARRFAETFSWDATATRWEKLLRSSIDARSTRA